MTQKFICSQTKIQPKLLNLTHISTSDDGWTKRYLDKDLNEQWLLTWHGAGHHGGGLQVLKKLPEPVTEELIEIALTSEYLDDIIGASRELVEREISREEDFREKLLDGLNKIKNSIPTEFEIKRINVIILESQLFDSINRRNVIGKHIHEIESDARYFNNSAEQARNMLNELST